MPIFAKAISLYSTQPPDALRERLRGIVTGKLRLPRQSRWRSPVLWSLREQPGASIRLMPLSPPDYREQQPSFVGTIHAEGSGSRVSGLVAPYALTVWVIAWVLLMDALMAGGGVVQEISRHHLSQALAFAMFGIVFATVAVSMLRLSVSWAVADITQLIEAAASMDPHQAIAASPSESRGPIVDNTSEQPARGVLVLRIAAVIDLLLAAFLLTSSVVRSRIGRPLTLLVAAVLVSGAGVLFLIAHRLGSERSGH